MFIMRALMAVTTFCAIHWDLPVSAAEVPQPNGFAQLVPLGWLANETLLQWIGMPLVAAGLAVWVMGWFPVFSLLPAVFYAAATGSLRNSMGDIGHSTQLPVMVLLGQWAAYVSHALRTGDWVRASPAAHRDAVLWALVVLAAGYLASAIVKLKASRFTWFERVPFLAVQVIKSNLSDYYSSLEPASPFFSETVPRLIVKWPNLARCFFGTGFFLELLAPLLLFNRRMTFWFGAALIAMHAGISLIMEIEFWFNIALLGIFCIIPGWKRRL